MKNQFLFSLILSFCLCACAGTTKDVVSAWPTDYSAQANSAMTAWLLGHPLDTVLNDETAQADAESMLLWAENANQTLDVPSGMKRYIQFIQKYPDHRLTPTAIIQLIQSINNTRATTPVNDILSLRTEQPYAKALLTLLDNEVIDYAITRELTAPSHPIALPLTKFSWFGPFTKRVLTESDIPLPFDDQPILPDSTDFEGRTLNAFHYATRTSTTFKAAHLGLYVGETAFDAAENMDVMLVIASPNGFEAQVDQKSVTSAEFIGVHHNPVSITRLNVEPGHHTLRVRLSKMTLTTDEAIHVWLVPVAKQSENAQPPRLSALTETTPRAERAASTFLNEVVPDYVALDVDKTSKNGLNAWAYNVMSIYHRDMKSADTMIKARQKVMSNDVQNVFMNVPRMVYDTDYNESSRLDAAITSLESIHEMNPDYVDAIMNLASLLLQKHYTQQAFDLVSANRDKIPENVDSMLFYEDLYSAKDWKDDARDAIREAYRYQPDSCSVTLKYIEAMTQINAMPARQELSETMQRCPRVAQFYDQRGLGDEKVMASLETRYPDNASIRINRLIKEAKSAPDAVFSEVMAIYDEFEKGNQAPIKLDVIMPLIDILRTQGREAEANKLVDRIIEVMPNEEFAHYIKWIMNEKKPFEGLRKDAMTVIKDYVASAPVSDASNIEVLDYAVHKYFENGSCLQLTHSIRRVLDKDGKNTAGEIYLPKDAAILHIRTIKQDTYEIYEPETIDHKDSISAPNLGVGDFIDIEYVTWWNNPLAPIQPDNFLDARFYFGILRTPIVHSEYVIEYPSNWQVQQNIVQPDIVKPSCVQVDHATRCTTLVTNIAPFIDEPKTVTLDELIPSIQFVSKFSWPLLQRNLAHHIASKTLITPYVTDYLSEMNVPEGSIRERTKYIYNYVLDNIDDSEEDDYLSHSATQTITSHIGSRMPTTKALLDAAGIPNYIGFIESLATPKNLPYPPQDYPNYYDAVLVVESEDGPIYLQPQDDFIPFDYLQVESQGQRVIPLTPDGEIIKSRVDPFDQLVSKVSIKYDINADGSAQVTAHEDLNGDRSLIMRYVLENSKTDPEQIHRIIQDNLARNYGRITLSDFTYHGLDRNEQLSIDYAFEAGNFAFADQNGLHVQSRIFSNKLVNTHAQLSKRRTPLLFVDVYLTDREFSFVAPDGYKFTKPKDLVTTINTKFGRYELQYTFEGQTMTIHEQIELRPQRVEPNEYADFFNFFNRIDGAQQFTIEMTR